MIIFSDLINKFQLIDYSTTHSQLLLRSMRNKARDFNIDIHIKGVFSLLMPTVFQGIEIAIFEIGDEKKYLIEEYGFDLAYHRIFSLKNSEGKVYFVNAMSFGIYHNKLDILETSIGRYDFGSLDENILWYAD